MSPTEIKIAMETKPVMVMRKYIFKDGTVKTFRFHKGNQKLNNFLTDSNVQESEFPDFWLDWGTQGNVPIEGKRPQKRYNNPIIEVQETIEENA